MGAQPSIDELATKVRRETLLHDLDQERAHDARVREMSRRAAEREAAIGEQVTAARARRAATAQAPPQAPPAYEAASTPRGAEGTGLPRARRGCGKAQVAGGIGEIVGQLAGPILGAVGSMFGQSGQQAADPAAVAEAARQQQLATDLERERFYDSRTREIARQKREDDAEVEAMISRALAKGRGGMAVGGMRVGGMCVAGAVRRALPEIAKHIAAAARGEAVPLATRRHVSQALSALGRHYGAPGGMAVAGAVKKLAAVDETLGRKRGGFLQALIPMLPSLIPAVLPAISGLVRNLFGRGAPSQPAKDAAKVAARLLRGAAEAEPLWGSAPKGGRYEGKGMSGAEALKRLAEAMGKMNDALAAKASQLESQVLSPADIRELAEAEQENDKKVSGSAVKTAARVLRKAGFPVAEVSGLTRGEAKVAEAAAEAAAEDVKAVGQAARVRALASARVPPGISPRAYLASASKAAAKMSAAQKKADKAHRKQEEAVAAFFAKKDKEEREAAERGTILSKAEKAEAAARATGEELEKVANAGESVILRLNEARREAASRGRAAPPQLQREAVDAAIQAHPGSPAAAEESPLEGPRVVSRPPTPAPPGPRPDPFDAYLATLDPKARKTAEKLEAKMALYMLTHPTASREEVIQRARGSSKIRTRHLVEAYERAERDAEADTRPMAELPIQEQRESTKRLMAELAARVREMDEGKALRAEEEERARQRAAERERSRLAEEAEAAEAEAEAAERERSRLAEERRAFEEAFVQPPETETGERAGIPLPPPDEEGFGIRRRAPAGKGKGRAKGGRATNPWNAYLRAHQAERLPGEPFAGFAGRMAVRYRSV